MPLPLIEPQQNRQPIRSHDASMTKPWPSPVGAAAMVEFGRFQVLLRRRKLLSEGVPIELGTRAFDLLLVLLEADGALVTKEELLRRVWPSVVVAEENLKVQICALRKALGENGDLIQTEFGRGYRFTAAVRATPGWSACRPSTRQLHQSRQLLHARRNSALSFHGWRCTAGG